jgi:hypothetical protein
MEESDVPANYIVRDVRRVVLGMSDTGAGPGKVVVDRVMSLDRFIAGPDHAMDWVIDYNTKYSFPEVCTPPGPGDSGCRHG